MAWNFCDMRFILIAAALVFILLQVHLYTTQTEYPERLAIAIGAENQCRSHTRLLIDQISLQQEKIVNLEDLNRRYEEESAQLKTLVRDLEKKSFQRISGKFEVPVAAVVIMACNRPDYLERTISSVLKYQSAVTSKFPLFVSQDGTNPDVKKTALSYSQITYMQHLDFEPVHTERPGELIAYYKIARHYKWALDELFLKHNFDRVIILEDDMEIAPDFFDYFEATAALLDRDKSIMAVSSWNDNGQVQFVHDPKALYRSDFFPGLGWMLLKATWEELTPKWPKAYWDDWIRLKDVHKDRQFVHPEICRTYNFGEHGSSMGQFFKQYLEAIKLNDVLVDWKSMDLSYMMEGEYQKHFAKLVSDAVSVPGPDTALKAKFVDRDVRIQYKDQLDFERIARQFGIFEEWKDGVPRTAYKGVVVFRYRSAKRFFFVGPDSLRQLGIA
ncbi:alpha-1,3-mannosyl-glycoprotein 2-beta-N-acetylglucosaminyltransferase [Phalaenopsis equestris]|uniref:alpha-1,3-mannosyl-glycoprotein 2-beta-N-acetylglucosaminyltransferase n=1 Tax=Phalaenopsis equestris TaxID=78828 RepID=UPI0009E4BF9B|nr:alpha-1,3-mannosyl-glycoprotein 2-beta-N-acetylglucosaminyltransferase [Phalaenopsis equestris]